MVGLGFRRETNGDCMILMMIAPCTFCLLVFPGDRQANFDDNCNHRPKGGVIAGHVP